MEAQTSKSLWSDFMKAKYWNNQHPLDVQWIKGNSQHWKYLCGIKHNTEKFIYWKLEKGDMTFWFDNWSSLEPLISSAP